MRRFVCLCRGSDRCGLRAITYHLTNGRVGYDALHRDTDRFRTNVVGETRPGLGREVCHVRLERVIFLDRDVDQVVVDHRELLLSLTHNLSALLPSSTRSASRMPLSA